jgi:hypothetical protein
MAVLVIVLTLLFAGLVEFGRFLILKEQTQTASDAAALAASYSGVKKWVNIDVITDRGNKTVYCCDEDGCYPCGCEPCGIRTENVTGLEKDLINGGEWEDYCVPPCSCGGGSCWYVIKKRWVEYSQQHSQDAAEAFALVNLPDQAEDVWLNRGSPKIRHDVASVVVYLKSRARSLFPNVFGASYETETCSEAATFYYDPKTGKWRKAPEDACWKN